MPDNKKKRIDKGFVPQKSSQKPIKPTKGFVPQKSSQKLIKLEKGFVPHRSPKKPPTTTKNPCSKK